MAINNDYTDKAEWQRGYDYGIVGIKEALDNAENKTKQGYYIATRIFNKKMAEEHYTKNRKSDDFLAGMETAIQTEFQNRWETAPAEPIRVEMNAGGIPGLVGMHFPAGIPPNQINKTPIKKLKPVVLVKINEHDTDELEIL
jgi:2-methylcitrate dehydratase PrpD